jgi:hypothetical protein
MGMFDLFRRKIISEPAQQAAPVPEPKVPAAPKKSRPVMSEKELATQRGEPWVSVLSMDIDPENLHQGSFELDWNDKFVANLVRAGYQMKPTDTDSDVVDRWFQNVCRHVVMETWEQEQAANPNRVVKTRNVGGGRTEVS